MVVGWLVGNQVTRYTYIRLEVCVYIRQKDRTERAEKQQPFSQFNKKIVNFGSKSNGKKGRKTEIRQQKIINSKSK